MRRATAKTADRLLPILGTPKRTRIVTYDVESKAIEIDETDPGRPPRAKSRDTQAKGFSRAFMVGFFDGDEHESGTGVGGTYTAFRNAGADVGDRRGTSPVVAARLAALPPEERAIAPGGCVDRFLRFLFGYASTQGKNCEGIKDEYTSRHTTIYAHNGGRFDATFVLAWLRRHRGEFDTRITCVASRAQRIVVTRKRRDQRRRLHRKMPSWTFVDSALMLPMSLAEAAKTFCAKDPEVRKLEDFDLDTPESDPRWEVYNRMDCLVLHRAITELRDLVETLGGELGITAPATSMKLFRRAFLKAPIERNRHLPSCIARAARAKKNKGKYACKSPDQACLHTWIRQGYHGGRVEIFEMIAPPGSRYYDLNSSYPASMRAPMPVGDATEVDPAEFYDLLPSLERAGQIGFVECDVTIPETCSIPPLPYPSEDGKLRFPVGAFSGVWSWEELRLLKDPFVGGTITAIRRSVWFRAERVFREFVDALYFYRVQSKADPKDEGKAALSELCKLMLNSHYGKYGMHPEREELAFIDGGADPMPGDFGSIYPKEGTPIDGNHLRGDVWVIPNRIDAAYMIPQIASHITALSRIALWKADVAAVLCGGRPCYNDTDSIMIAPPIDMDEDEAVLAAWWKQFEATLGLGNQLGEWKREFPTWVLSAQFLLPKSYLIRNELKEDDRIVKLKGVGRKARTEANFLALARGEEVTYQRVEQHRTILKEGRHAPREVDAKKSIQTTYDKRERMGGGPGGGAGVRTRPVVLGGNLTKDASC